MPAARSHSASNRCHSRHSITSMSARASFKLHGGVAVGEGAPPPRAASASALKGAKEPRGYINYCYAVVYITP